MLNGGTQLENDTRWLTVSQSWLILLILSTFVIQFLKQKGVKYFSYSQTIKCYFFNFS